jgi:hypothetical protein
MMDRIVTMDEIMVCYHTPETKKQSKQWVKKGQPGPINAVVHASQTKQIIMTVVIARAPLASTLSPEPVHQYIYIYISINYVVSVLDTFLRHLRKKRGTIWHSSSNISTGTMYL